MTHTVRRFALLICLAAATLWVGPQAGWAATQAGQKKSPRVTGHPQAELRLLHPNILMRRGWRAHERGETDKAISIFEYGIRLFPKDPSLHYDLGCLYALRKNFSMARKGLRAAVLLNPRFAAAYDALGQSYEQEYFFDEALLFYAAATELDMHNVRFLQHLARVQQRIGQVEGARETLRQMLLFSPEDTEGRYRLGVLLSDAGEHEESARQFREVAQRLPGHVMAWNGLGLAYIRLKRFDEAAQVLRKAEALEPDSPVTQNHLGVLAAEQRLWDQAKASWESALRMSPGFSPAAKNLREFEAVTQREPTP